MIFSNVHYVEALLNPYLKEHAALKGDGVALLALYRVIHLMKDVVGLHFDDVLQELMEYDEDTEPYSPDLTLNLRKAKMTFHQWWHKVVDRTLSKIFVCILAHTCSASSYERNWNIYSLVHNKRRN